VSLGLGRVVVRSASADGVGSDEARRPRHCHRRGIGRPGMVRAVVLARSALETGGVAKTSPRPMVRGEPAVAIVEVRVSFGRQSTPHPGPSSRPRPAAAPTARPPRATSATAPSADCSRDRARLPHPCERQTSDGGFAVNPVTSPRAFRATMAPPNASRNSGCSAIADTGVANCLRANPGPRAPMSWPRRSMRKPPPSLSC
jgi:hypothetical protein